MWKAIHNYFDNMFKTIQLSLKDVLDIKALTTQLILYLPQLIAGGIILFMFYGFYRLIRYFLVKYFTRHAISESVVHLIVKVLRFSSLGLALILVADQIGIKIIAIISTLGVAGIALGLAAQQTLANFISGIILLVSKPFTEGDLVELEGTFGRVKEISLRSTAVLTMDNILVDIPNQKIVESKIINHTYNQQIRVRTKIGVAYKTSIPEAQRVLLDLIKNDDRCLTEPAPEVIVDEYADSSIILELRVWLKDSQQQVDIDNEITEKIKAEFDKAGIEIPFPHRQVFIESAPVDDMKKVVRSN